MQGSRKTQVVLVAGALALTAALYFAPKAGTTAKPAAAKEEAVKQEFNFDQLLAFQKKNLTASELEKTESWVAQLKEPASRVNLSIYDSLAKVWDDKKMFSLSANYFEQKAGKDNTEKSYLNAAYRYFDAYKNSPDSLIKQAMVDKAIKNYSKVIELNGENLDAKTDLGILYAEATAEPMKGIMLLREVITKNPEHENAQLNLGFLSVKSKQYDKALERFDKVLQINPKKADVYIYKAQTYLQMNDKQKAIESFEKYMKESTDKQMIGEVNEYLNELKK